ncbi:FkbM family methyltransferase [Alphaproteobacteria bacterium]|nr:FkbM family methyltransferase [Alphaproteobacteria bacterium]MDC1085889.1 FkbM family methyltransferase [Alphaproteobacteria bacterium]
MIRTIYRNLKITKKIRNFFEAPSLVAISRLPNKGEVTLGDIGAAGEIQPRWEPFSKNLNYIGFEPDKRSRKTITNKNTNFKSYQILPYALSDSEKTLSLHLCKKPQVSSLYEPNSEILDKYPDSKRFEVVKIATVDCVSLDSLNLPKIEFLKIDIQGAENDVLKGASSTLNSVLGLEVEVEFIEIYKEQPLFGDICKTLSKNGLDFVELYRWERGEHNAHGQCVFGDALFLKSPEALCKSNLDVDTWSTYITILMIYKRFDLIEVVLGLLNQDIKKHFTDFEVSFSKVKKRETTVKRIHFYLNWCFTLLGENWRLHVIR